MGDVGMLLTKLDAKPSCLLAQCFCRAFLKITQNVFPLFVAQFNPPPEL
jgi:hypothetical protein